MSILARWAAKREEKNRRECEQLTREMVDAFSSVCGLMDFDSFCRVMAVLIERYRLENDVTVGQLRYSIEQTYSKMATTNR